MAINTQDPTVTAASHTVGPFGREHLSEGTAEELVRLRAELEMTRRELACSRAENSRQQSVDQLHATMLSNVLDAVITVDNQHRIRYLNPAAERQYQVRAGEVIGAPLSRLYRCCWVNPADEALVSDALQNTGRWRGEHEQELPDGTRLQVETVFSTLRDAAGTALGTLLCTRDVSDRATMQSALRYSEEQFRSWLLNIPAPIYIKDHDGRYLLANQWAEQALRNPLGIIGRDDFELLPRETAARLRDHDHEVLESNQPSQREQSIYDRCYLSLKFPLRSSDDRPAAVCGINIDITELKRAQLELGQVRDQLHTQLAILKRLRDLSVEPTPTGDSEAVLESILRTAVELHGASHGLICLLDHRTGRLQAGVSIHLDALAERQLAGLLPLPSTGGNPPSGLNCPSIHDIEIEACNDRLREAGRRIGFRAMHGTPILGNDGGLLGILSLHFKQPRRYIEMEQHVVELCARQIALTLQSAANQRAVQESEARFRTMADSAPVMVWVADAQHSCTYLSKAWYEFTGQRPEDGLGFGWASAVHPDDREDLYREFITAAEERRTLHFECRFRRFDGSYRWCLDTATPRRSCDGRFAGFVGSVVDVTERKAQESALRQSEKLYRAIGEALDYGIWICDADGRNRYVSESFLRLVGLTQDECSLYGWVRHLHPDEAQETLAAWRECVRTGGIWNRVHRFKGLDGNYHSLLARGLPVRDDLGQIVCWAGINLDVSHEQQAHLAVQKAEVRMHEFLALLSREARNPLTPIRSAFEALKSQALSSQMRAQNLGIIEQYLGTLERLLENCQDLSSIHRGTLTLNLQPVLLQETLRDLTHAAEPVLAAAGYALTVELPPQDVQLYVDRTRLTQMLMGLLDICANHMPGGGGCKLSTVVCGNELHLKVQDGSTGCDAAALPQPYGTHAQPGVSTACSEVGFGLTLVKRLAEMHGGQVTECREGPSQDRTFLLVLPLNASPQQEQPLPKHTPLDASVSVRRVLIADDNPDAAQTLAMLLDLMGHDTQVVNDGLEAIDAVQSFAPDFVFMDIGMPNLDGIEATRRIRQLGLIQQPRIVAVSGWTGPDDLDLSQTAGIDYHVVKPISMQTLQALIDDNARSLHLH